MPINKTPNTRAPSNYRPSKVMEKCVSHQIINLLTINKIINPLQSEFQSGYTTETCLVKLAKAKKIITALILFEGMGLMKTCLDGLIPICQTGNSRWYLNGKWSPSGISFGSSLLLSISTTSINA